MPRSRPRHDDRNFVAIGLIALAIIAVLLFFGFTKDNPFSRGFRIQAQFESANSIRDNSPVRIAGVNVGKVVAIDAVEGSEPRGRDGQDPAADLPGGQLLRRPLAGHARVARARGRRHHQGHADQHARPARRGADAADQRHA
jgi:hypothetical protein